MTFKAGRQKRKVLLRETLKVRNNTNNIKNSRDNSGNRETKNSEKGKYYSMYKDIQDRVIGRIIYKIPKDELYGTILFGFKHFPKMRYDTLIVGETEYGYIPTEFITYNREKMNLLFLLDLDKDDPYEEIFKELKRHFQKRRSLISIDTLKFVYFEEKKCIANYKMNEDTVFFLEQRKSIPYKLYFG